MQTIDWIKSITLLHRQLHKVFLHLFIKIKVEAFEMFKYYNNKVQNQLNKKIKAIKKMIEVENTRHLLVNFIQKKAL